MSNTEKKDGWVGVLNGQPKIGQFSERSRTTKMSDIHSFTEMTGDKASSEQDTAGADILSLRKLAGIGK